jgi:Flp pilus assembly protein TadG
MLKDQKGTSLVEFSIVALLFLTLIFGIIEFGLLLFNQQVVTNAGREGARLGIVARPDGHKITKTDVKEQVENYAQNYIVSFGEKKFSVTANFESGLSYCEKFRDNLTVKVTYDYSFLFLPFVTKTLGTTSIMICE